MNNLNDIASQLVEAAKDKSIVLLGESAHGVHEFNSLRALFIKKLHNTLGFKVVMIESISKQCVTLELGSVKELVKEHLHEVYHTEELISLFEFARQNHLTISGFEIFGADLERYREMKRVGDDWGARSWRDEVMFRNLVSLIDTEFSGQKVIVWAHNNHIMKKTSPGAARSKVLGEYLYEKYGSSLLSVGQYAATGEFEHMPGERVELSVLPKNPLSDAILSAPNDMVMLPALKSSEFDREMSTLMGARTIETINPANHFDALVLHRSASTAWRIK